MNQDDFTKLLDEALKPLKEGRDELRQDLQEVKHTQGQLAEDLKEVKDTQERQLLPSVVTIETTIKAYGDMYKINNSNSKKLEKRIEVLEDKSGIAPPPEFTLTDVS